MEAVTVMQARVAGSVITIASTCNRQGRLVPPALPLAASCAQYRSGDHHV